MAVKTSECIGTQCSSGKRKLRGMESWVGWWGEEGYDPQSRQMKACLEATRMENLGAVAGACPMGDSRSWTEGEKKADRRA